MTPRKLLGDLLTVRRLLDAAQRYDHGVFRSGSGQVVSAAVRAQALARLRRLAAQFCPPAEDELRDFAEHSEQLLATLIAHPTVSSSVTSKARSARRWAIAGLATLGVFACCCALTYFWPRWPPGTALTSEFNWTLSSALPGYAPSGSLVYGSDVDFFFSTNFQKYPNMVIDLEKPTQVVGLQVTNRRECCYERPLPLTLSVSTDGQTWTPVAQRTQPFYTWRPRFSPHAARYLKLQVESESWLHLHEIRIFEADSANR